MKKGKFSLVLSIIIMIVGCAFVLLGVLSHLGVLAPPLSDLSETLSEYISITGGRDKLWESGAFLIFDALLVLVLRGRKPYSMFVVHLAHVSYPSFCCKKGKWDFIPIFHTRLNCKRQSRASICVICFGATVSLCAFNVCTRLR